MSLYHYVRRNQSNLNRGPARVVGGSPLLGLLSLVFALGLLALSGLVSSAFADKAADQELAGFSELLKKIEKDQGEDKYDNKDFKKLNEIIKDLLEKYKAEKKAKQEKNKKTKQDRRSIPIRNLLLLLDRSLKVADVASKKLKAQIKTSEKALADLSVDKPDSTEKKGGDKKKKPAETPEEVKLKRNQLPEETRKKISALEDEIKSAKQELSLLNTLEGHIKELDPLLREKLKKLYLSIFLKKKHSTYHLMLNYSTALATEVQKFPAYAKANTSFFNLAFAEMLLITLLACILFLGLFWVRLRFLRNSACSLAATMDVKVRYHFLACNIVRYLPYVGVMLFLYIAFYLFRDAHAFRLEYIGLNAALMFVLISLLMRSGTEAVYIERYREQEEKKQAKAKAAAKQESGESASAGTPIEEAPKASIKLRFNVRVVLRTFLFLGVVAWVTAAHTRLAGMAAGPRLLLMDLLFIPVLLLGWVFVSRFSRAIEAKKRGMIMFVATLYAVLAFLLVVTGYRALALYSLYIVSVAGISLFAYVYLNSIVSELHDLITEPSKIGNMRIKKQLLKHGKLIKAVVPWLNGLIKFSLFVLLCFVLLKLLPSNDLFVTALSNYFFSGIKVGSIVVNPSLILLSIGVFALIHIATGWIKNQLNSRLFKMSRVERSAREAVVTLIGYVGISIGVVVALAILGMDFGNLAIIAGALSVGIGFGLQNIVNNFVSGIIILFERPIKTGDWVSIGGVEGYVKKISIRATIIRTFDNADVVVPNSELISSKLTNWMYMDRKGRVTVPVGVAYGSDTDKVTKILSETASNHPDVVKNDSEFPIRVLFRQFADSSLNFEVRFFIHDIDKRLQVMSEVMYEVDKAFREQGITIPFPQRDVHLMQAGSGGAENKTESKLEKKESGENNG